MIRQITGKVTLRNWKKDENYICIDIFDSIPNDILIGLPGIVHIFQKKRKKKNRKEKNVTFLTTFLYQAITKR